MKIAIKALRNSKSTFEQPIRFNMPSIPASPIASSHYEKFRVWIGCVALALIAAGSVRAGIFEEGDLLMAQVAPGAIHYNSSPDHADFSWLVGLEWQSSSRWLVGASYFNNSFDQKCEYFYFGKSWPLEFISSNVYFKLTGGLLLGYKEPYEDKIPFNNNGVAPGVVPALGYQYGDFNVQINALGGAGLMFTFGYNFIKW
ncbi:MAG: hypothetical protein JNK95_09560 [Candidatus Competibacter sp.]|nr:hypothetical protein [Candidatus Competibacter sp.]MDG4604874.1 hypothetical protein [Candidatus Contendobacter sp.]HRD48650.1 hypothetical protein [Candidatus Contendobacter sp.]